MYAFDRFLGENVDSTLGLRCKLVGSQQVKNDQNKIEEVPRTRHLFFIFLAFSNA